MSPMYPGVIIQDYDHRPLMDLCEEDYHTLLRHLRRQLASLLGGNPYEAYDCAGDALTNERQPELTAREWLEAAGARLGVDTARCVGV
jgi:hypothetical protein